MHGHGYGQWEFEGVVHAMKKSRVWRLRFCNCHFFWQQGFLESQKNGFGDFFLPPSPCPSLFNGPVCCPQPIVCNSWVVVALFVKHVFCCWGHHILKKNKLWGMHACNFLLACPQTSDGQTSNVHGTPCLPLLGPQCPCAPKKVTVSPGLGAPQSGLTLSVVLNSLLTSLADRLNKVDTLL